MLSICRRDTTGQRRAPAGDVVVTLELPHPRPAVDPEREPGLHDQPPGPGFAPAFRVPLTNVIFCVRVQVDDANETAVAVVLAALRRRAREGERSGGVRECVQRAGLGAEYWRSTGRAV
jgi:hypothetical protein